ncbi:hypothetical protein KFK09_009240 [Dendrobium nobile]|uniref:Uncharacterized protein n=1 Tax=Dendrobium nobile TaxID=94219 RepID=A0A8T3BT00_DENNO|nr:hypothetical protein KFK09_009240 [Dendrobium nobile]
MMHYNKGKSTGQKRFSVLLHELQASFLVTSAGIWRSLGGHSSSDRFIFIYMYFIFFLSSYLY